ncbi:MAG TPA: hypothetical protein VFF86_07835 [Candidatus Methylomirabilis sp.]|nr:hypothetical protein [Candidatus Methylomirabilis sp.]
MASQQVKFRHAALSYLIYGCLYLIGAMYVAASGISGRAMTARSGLIWFIVGAALVVLFPWLINKGYVWFTRTLVLLVLFRATSVVKVIIKPTIAAIPLPGGIELSMRVGALFFLLVTLGTGYLLARAAWDLSP